MKVHDVFAPDDRTGNVLTTIGLFAAVATLVYAARATLTLFVLSLLLAYLLEPMVAWLQGLRPLRSSGRTGAIALVYLTGALLIAGAAYALGPAIAAQLQRLGRDAPALVERVSKSAVGAQSGASMAGVIERVAAATAAAAQDAGWLLMVPVVAFFFLNNRAALINGTVDLFARRRDRTNVKHAVEQIDTMLAQYMRAQLVLAGLSSAFYSLSMALLGFPYALAIGIPAGALEFLPVLGWILAAAVILAAGWLTHAHWIPMAILLVIWRVIQNVVMTPRVMGTRLEMDPITVIFALMAGGEIAGLLGVVLSVPVVAVLRIVWLEHAGRQKAETG